MPKRKSPFRSSKTVKNIELPENYKQQHMNRVYFPNLCNYCSSSSNLLKCSSCLTVSYCSKQHQKDDWLFHKPTCTALKKIKSELTYPENCDYGKFVKYSQKMLRLLMDHRGFKFQEDLTQYETQICLLPRVCVVCFKNDSSKYLCSSCQSVSYCSVEHLESDKKIHSSTCKELKICRLLSSMVYEEGFKPDKMKIKITYCPISKDVKKWPKSKMELCALVQRDLNNFHSDEAIIAINYFIDPYIPGAMIINALESAGIIRNRHLMTKSSRAKWRFEQSVLHTQLMENPSETAKNKSTLTIHFPYSFHLELGIHWEHVARILVDWIHNIDDVEVILTGPRLKLMDLPKFDFDEKLIRLSVHPKLYEDILFTKPPDVMVIFECRRTILFDKDFWHTKCINGLFRYHNVPIILASGDPVALDLIQDALNIFPFVEILEDISENDFTDYKVIRTFHEHFDTIRKNSTFTILRRC